MPTMFVTVVIVSTTVMMGGDGMVLFVQSQDLNKTIQAIFCILAYASNECDEGHSFGVECVLVTVLIGAFVRFCCLVAARTVLVPCLFSVQELVSCSPEPP